MHGIAKDNKTRVFTDLLVAAARLSHTNLTISSAEVQRSEIDILLKRYREAFFEYCDELEEFCVKRQLLYFRSPIQEPFDELVMRVFRAGGFLK